MLSSKLQNTVSNLINNSNFERTPDWTATDSTITFSALTGTAYLGNKSVKMVSSGANSSGYGISKTFSVVAGETYTFSAYVKTSKASAYLQLSDSSNTEKSEVIASYTDWTRLEVSIKASSSTITARLLTTDEGHIYMDCAQLEKSPTASRYNLVENGDFRETTYWSGGTRTQSTEGTAAPQLNATVCTLSGNPQATSRINQDIQVKGNAGDTFVIAGWAYGYSVPLSTTDNNRKYGFVVNFVDGSTVKSTKVVQFNPSIEGWQYISNVLVAETAYTSIKVQLAYDYNANDVYFDGIQLYKEEFGQSYDYDDDGNVVSVTDLQKQKTTYEYEDNNLSKAIMPSGAVLEYDYDNWHNVISATSSTGIKYSFTYDDWGNNTSVSITYNNVSITSSATYTDDHNRLSKTTDSAGNVTQYEYDKDTNVLNSVQYPNDTADTKTNYTYDNMYRMASAAMTTDSNLALSATYTYENDLLTKIQTPSTTYTFDYGAFALRSSVKIGNRELAKYSYTANTNYLDTLEYGNQDKVQYTYDTQGRVTQETYEDGDTVKYKYDNSGALATVTDSATGITTTYYYDFIDRMMKYVEKGSRYNHSVGYEYDNINNLTAMVETINDSKYTTSYTYDLDNRLTSITNGSASESYTYDGYGRIASKVTKHGSGTVTTETYTYKTTSSGASTNQVASIAITGTHNVTYTYEYDSNGNITTISDGTNTTTYVYDSANQLIRENNQGANKTWTWTYDNSGNIDCRKEYDYNTGDLNNATCISVDYSYDVESWGDLLIDYNGQNINYDEIGNPLTDSTWTYTWEHGRELATMAQESAVIITTQPEDCFSAVGDRCSFNIGAIGTGLTYQWQYSSDGTIWKNSGNNTAVTTTFSISAINASQVGLLWRCIVTDATGKRAISQIARIVDPSVSSPITITNQPDNNYCTVGDPISFTVGAEGNSLTYKWQYSSDGGTTWKNSGNNTAVTSTFAVSAMNASQYGLLFRCVITDANGNTATTRSTTLKRDTTLWTHTYNADGLRTKRANGESTYEYTYLGGQLTYMTVDGFNLYFTYDDSGSPMAVTCNGTNYYYVTNLQGDVTAIVNSSGASVATYTYDAWGNLTSDEPAAGTIGTLNPLRYRGYVYDNESGLYYLQSRYYDPEMGRFINADAFTSTGLELLGNNMFAYCGNNPVNCVDYSGHFWDLIDKINDALDKAEDAINKWIMDSIGAGATIEHETSYEKELVPVPLNAFFSVKKGMKTTHTTFEIGNSSKLLSLFAIGRSDNYLFSSVGGRVNVSNTSLDLSLGLDSTGISISHSRGITTNTMGVVLDLSQLKVGFEFSETVVSNNTLVPNVTQYTNISITGIGIMAAYQLLTTGQWDTTLVPKSAT